MIIRSLFQTLVHGLCLLPLTAAQPQVSAPQYTTMHYVLMAVTVLVVAALVVGTLVLVRKEKTRRMRKPRRTLIKVRPRPTEETRVEGVLVVEDLTDDHQTIALAPRSTTYVKKT